ncbi:MAG: hypothetical protein CMF50_09200 [Legionellales bacterium]|nr:hypothetical protein [Legionellales bacterium]|tara:strand:+ start:1941 stop:2234 length:294 start_codon:yes stop_codon:yes gene_type:complete
MTNDKCRICVCSLGLALGITWGLGMLITGLFGTYTGYGLGFVNAMGSVYIGFDATLVGSFLGLVWGFADAFIAGVIIGWLYNLFSHCGCKKAQSSAE